MYPRNAASPPAIDLGQIVLLSDGTIQTSGASVRVKIGTGSWGAGAGSLDCDATSGIWTYTPTQAETAEAFFIVGVYKSGCSAQSRCVITSVSDTTGYAGLDWSKVRAPTTALNLSGTTIKTATDVETDTADIQTRLPAALVSGRIDASVGAYQAGLAPPTAAENGAAGWNRMLVDHTSTGSTGAALGLILAAVELLLVRIPSGVATMFLDLVQMITGSTTVNARFTTKALENAPGGANSGSGARTVTVTVNDGTNPLENAKVRMTNGGDTYTALTNVSGVAVFNLDDATWVVSITKGGYSFAGASLVVDGTETVTYSMLLVVITPSSPSLVTGYWTVLDENGSAAASVVVTIKARQPLRGGVGVIHDAGERTATSNGSGLVQFTNLIPGWRYAVVANDDYVADFVVPADAVTSVELGSIVARLP